MGVGDDAEAGRHGVGLKWISHIAFDGDVQLSFFQNIESRRFSEKNSTRPSCRHYDRVSNHTLCVVRFVKIGVPLR